MQNAYIINTMRTLGIFDDYRTVIELTRAALDRRGDYNKFLNTGSGSFVIIFKGSIFLVRKELIFVSQLSLVLNYIIIFLKNSA